MHRDQAEIVFVQILLHPAVVLQRSIGPVGPLVIGADELFSVPGFFSANLRPAMSADVVHGANDSIIATNHDHRIRIYLHDEEIADLGNLAGMPREEPLAPPDRIHLRAVNVGLRIKCSREGPAAATGGHEFGELC